MILYLFKISRIFEVSNDVEPNIQEIVIKNRHI